MSSPQKPAAVFLLAGSVLVAVTALGLLNTADRASASARGRPRDAAEGAPRVEAGQRGARPGVYGELLDWQRAPLPGLRIAIRREYGDVVDAAYDDGFDGAGALRVVRTDAQGGFGAPDLPAGRYSLVLQGCVRVARAVELRADESRHVELVVPGRSVLLSGTLRARGEPVAGRYVRVTGHDAGGPVAHAERTDERGVYRYLLRPGRYELSVEGEPLQVSYPRQGESVWVDAPGPEVLRVEQDLGDPGSRMRRDLDLPGTAIDVAVRDAATGLPVPGARVTLLRGEVQLGSRVTDQAGAVWLAELPYGDYRVTVDAVGRPLPTAQQVALTADAELAELEFALAAGGTATVVLSDPDGGEVLWHPDYRAAVVGLEAAVVDPGEQVWQPSRERAYVHAPAGECALVVADEEVAGGLRFGPLDPLRWPFTLPAGADIVVQVEGVAERAFGSFRVLDATGELAALADVQVWTAEPPIQRIAPLAEAGERGGGEPAEADRGGGPEGAALPRARWEGWLAPGRYDVVARTPDGEQHAQVTVGRSDVEHVFRR